MSDRYTYRTRCTWASGTVSKLLVSGLGVLDSATALHVVSLCIVVIY